MNNLEHLVYNSSIAVFYYHRICQLLKITNHSIAGFRDDGYLCFCTVAYPRAECFRFDPDIDQCSFCLNNGLCLKGDVQHNKDGFQCFCPDCYHGHFCQFSNALMSFTLDSLLLDDMQKSGGNGMIIFTCLVSILFVAGSFNNLCSLITFLKINFRQSPVGLILFILSIVDQFCLFILLLKVIYIALGSYGALFGYETLNVYACKIIAYFLAVLTRSHYWLTSFAAFQRLSLVIFPTSTFWKSPKSALVITVIIISLSLITHIHEVVFYTVVDDPSHEVFTPTSCIANYGTGLILTCNRINTLFQYFVPFFGQIIAISVLIYLVARNRSRLNAQKQKKLSDFLKENLKKQKELYIAPVIIVLSSLPQTILSFMYACNGLKQSWQRKTLLIAYFFSFTPQLVSFLINVLPSTTFRAEFKKTFIGKHFAL